jgi:hypothetical protein
MPFSVAGDALKASLTLGRLSAGNTRRGLTQQLDEAVQRRV